MYNINEIHERIFERSEAQRLVIKVRTEKLDSHDYRVSASKFINEVFPDWEHHNRICFIAIEIRGDRTFMVIDVNNFDYNSDTAHETKTILPVYVVWQHMRKGWFIIRWPQEDVPLATKVAELHTLNGFHATTPFLADYNNTRVVYENPRYLSTNL